MATKTESKKEHIEAILGEKIGDEAIALIQMWVDTAIVTTSSSRTVQRHTTANLPNRCFENRVVDVSGFAQTQDNGQATFTLTKFLCPANEIYSLPINVLATPISVKPIFLTVQHDLVNNGADVKITVFAWKPNGGAAGSVLFNWRCRVEHPHVIL